MCLKNQLLASKLSQTQINNIIRGTRVFVELNGSFEPLHDRFFDAYFPFEHDDVEFNPRLLNGCQELFISILIHISVLSFGYGIEVSRRVSEQAQRIGLSVNELKSIESAVFDDLLSRYMATSEHAGELEASFSTAIATLWESDNELVTTYKSQERRI